MTKWILFFAIVSVVLMLAIPIILIIRAALSLKDAEELAKTHDEDLHEYHLK